MKPIETEIKKKEQWLFLEALKMIEAPPERVVLGRKPHQKTAMVDAELEELWNEGVAVVVGDDETFAREEHGIPASQRVLMIPASEISNEADVWSRVTDFQKKPTSLLNAQLGEEDPVVLETSTPKFYVNLDSLGKADKHGGVWTRDEKQQLYYHPVTPERVVLGRKLHQKTAMVDEALQELWDDGVVVVVGDDESAAREEHGITESQRVLMIPASEIKNDADVRKLVRDFKKKPTRTLEAQPNTTNDKPRRETPVILDSSTAKFCVNPVLDVENAFGGMWTKDHQKGLLYRPTKGNAVPIKVNAVVRVMNDPYRILIFTEETDGVYYFREIHTKEISEAMRDSDVNCPDMSSKTCRDKCLTKAGKAIEPILSELSTLHGGITNPAVFYKILEDVMQIVAPACEFPVKEIALNSLPASGNRSSSDYAQNRMGFTRQWKDETWTHAFGGAWFTVTPGATREQAAKQYAERHAGLLIDRANGRPADKAVGLRLAAAKKVDAEHVDMKNALGQLAHMVETLVLAYDKLSSSTEADGSGLKEDIRKFLEMLGDNVIRQSDNAAQQVRMFELFAKVVTKIEGQASLNQLLIGHCTDLTGPELISMNYLDHHDARVRVRFREDYFSQVEALRLHGYLQKGFDMNSGRDAWSSQIDAVKKVMAEKYLPLGNDSVQQSIPYLIASLEGLKMVRTDSVAVNLSAWSYDLAKGVRELPLFRDAQLANHSKITDGSLKKAAGAVKEFIHDDYVNVIRDQQMVKELYALIEEIVDSPFIPRGDKEAFAVQQIDKAIALLYAKAAEAGNQNAAKDYADYLVAKFKGMTDAAEIMMMAMGHDQKEQEDIKPFESFLAGTLNGRAKFVTTVPLPYVYAIQPIAGEIESEEGANPPDPLEEAGLQNLLLLCGRDKFQPEDRNSAQTVFRPVSINGISTVEALISDALYRLNVAPAYTVLRAIIGRVRDADSNQVGIQNSLILGANEKNQDMRTHRLALAGVSWEIDNEVANDLEQGEIRRSFARERAKSEVVPDKPYGYDDDYGGVVYYDKYDGSVVY